MPKVWGQGFPGIEKAQHMGQEGWSEASKGKAGGLQCPVSACVLLSLREMGASGARGAVNTTVQVMFQKNHQGCWWKVDAKDGKMEAGVRLRRIKSLDLLTPILTTRMC